MIQGAWNGEILKKQKDQNTSLETSNKDLQKGLKAHSSKDYTTALKIFKKLAAQGDLRAQTVLGGMYLQGHGVKQDDATALKWFKLGAERGYDHAQNMLGLMYRDGRGVPKNKKLMMQWLSLAAAQGNPGAILNLRELLKKGETTQPEE